MNRCRNSQASLRYIALGIKIATFISFETPALGQIVPDNSLGTEGSRISPQEVRGALADYIQGGAVRDVHLFHSFSEFNVGELQRVYFANPTGIQNIFSRVTGGNLSNIRGTLGVDGNANLFFINPNGIFFGNNAVLDISGSFTASTANGFVFGNQGEFSATDPQTPPLLQVNLTPGLQWGTNHPQTITNRGNLTVGQDLTMAGGNLNLQGQLSPGHDLTLYATDTLTIRDRVTQPFMAIAGNELAIQGDHVIDIFALNHPHSGLFSGGDMVLRSPNPVGGDAHFFVGGSFRIEQLDGSLAPLSSPHDPIIRATGDVSFDSYTGASLHILAGGSVTVPGTITINAIDTEGNSLQEDVTLSDGTVVTVNGNLQPTLDIRTGVNGSAVGNPLLTPGSDGFTPTPNDSGTPSRANITVGIININAVDGLVLLTNQYQPNSSLNESNVTTGMINAFGSTIIIDAQENIIATGNINSNIDSGNAGDIKLLSDGGDIVTFDIRAFVGDGGTGTAGNITLISRNGAINTSQGAIFSSTTNGTGGEVTLTASGDIITAGIQSLIGFQGIGTAGNITLTSTTGSINTTAIAIDGDGNFSRGISSVVGDEGIGFAGNVTLTAFGDIITADILSEVGDNGVGNAGNIVFNSQTGTIDTTLGLLSSSTPGGESGSILLTSQDNIFAGNMNASSTSIDPTSQGGSINLTSNAIFVNNPVFIATDTLGLGQGGDINLQTQQLSVTNGAEILSRTFASGNAGNVTVEPLDPTNPSSVLLSGTVPLSLDVNGNFTIGGFSSGLFSTTEDPGTGNGGIITITTESLTIENGAVVSARTRTSGAGSDVFINVDTLEITGGGQVLASAFESGAAGNIIVNANESITIAGTDPTFTNRFNTLFGGRFNQFTAAGQSTEEAIANAFEQTEFTIDPVSLNSGLQASDLSGGGAAGNIELNAPTIVMSDIAILATNTRGANDGGDVTIRAQALTLESGAEILAQTFGSGKGGDVILEPLDPTLPSSVNMSGVVPFTGFIEGATFQLGAPQAVSPNGGFSTGVFVSTENPLNGIINGQGGTITITTDEFNLSDGAALSARTRSAGRGGSIAVNVDTLNLTGGAQILGPAFSTGASDGITINATGDINISGFDPTWNDRLTQIRDALELQGFDSNSANQQARFTVDPVSPASGFQATVEFEATANTNELDIGGNINVNSGGSLTLDDNAQIEVGTFGFGNAGNILIDVEGDITINNFGGIRSSIAPGARGNGGSIEILSDGSFSLDNQGIITTGTAGLGDSGSLVIDVEGDIRANNASTIRSTVEQGGIGNGGAVTIRGRSFTMTGGSQITAGVFRSAPGINGGIGNGGNINIDVTDFISLVGTDADGFRSGLFANTETGAMGNAGDILINARTLTIANQGIINGSTSNENAAGDIIFTLEEGLTIDNLGLVSVSGLGEGENIGNPGNIDITAGSILLNLGGKIQAITNSGENANITLNVEDSLVLRGLPTAPFNSEISTEARGTGNGGNMIINVGGAIVARLDENSDIVANAFGGTGGNISATALQIGTFRESEGRTLESDFVASSVLGIDGTVDTETEEVAVDINLNLNLFDPVALIDRTCRSDSQGSQSSFIITGRGGIPLGPTDDVESDTIISNWVTGEGETQANSQDRIQNEQERPISETIIEAQGWIVDSQGNIILTANPVTTNPISPWTVSWQCH